MYTLLRNVHPQPNKHNFRPVILKSNDVDLRSMTFKSDLHNVKMNQSGKICVVLFKSNRPDTHTHTHTQIWTALSEPLAVGTKVEVVHLIHFCGPRSDISLYDETANVDAVSSGVAINPVLSTIWNAPTVEGRPGIGHNLMSS